MIAMWAVWMAGVAILAVAGFAAALLPRRRAAGDSGRAAWAIARAAIASAGVSRDAAATELPEADQLLLRAELLAAGRGGLVVAETAADCARRADRMWRAAASDA
jgi:hypothetical protein